MADYKDAPDSDFMPRKKGVANKPVATMEAPDEDFKPFPKAEPNKPIFEPNPMDSEFVPKGPPSMENLSLIDKIKEKGRQTAKVLHATDIWSDASKYREDAMKRYEKGLGPEVDPAAYWTVGRGSERILSDVEGLAELPAEIASLSNDQDIKEFANSKMRFDIYENEWTNKVMRTKAYREIEAEQKGAGAVLLNNIKETTFDTAYFLMLWAKAASAILPKGAKALKVAGVSGAKALKAGATGSAAVKAEKALLTGSKLAKVADAAKAAQAARFTKGASALKLGKGAYTLQAMARARAMQSSANIIKRAAMMGGLRATVTRGSIQERAVAGMNTALYMGTPAISGLVPLTQGTKVLAKVPWVRGLAKLSPEVFQRTITDGKLAAVAIDTLMNTLITTNTMYKQLWEQYKDKPSMFFAHAIPGLLTDIYFSLGTRSLNHHISSPVIQRAYNDKKYADLVKNGSVPEVMNEGAKANTLDGKEFTILDTAFNSDGKVYVRVDPKEVGGDKGLIEIPNREGKWMDAGLIKETLGPGVTRPMTSDEFHREEKIKIDILTKIIEFSEDKAGLSEKNVSEMAKVGAVRLGAEGETIRAEGIKPHLVSDETRQAGEANFKEINNIGLTDAKGEPVFFKDMTDLPEVLHSKVAEIMSIENADERNAQMQRYWNDIKDTVFWVGGKKKNTQVWWRGVKTGIDKGTEKSPDLLHLLDKSDVGLNNIIVQRADLMGAMARDRMSETELMKKIYGEFKSKSAAVLKKYYPNLYRRFNEYGLELNKSDTDRLHDLGDNSVRLGTPVHKLRSEGGHFKTITISDLNHMRKILRVIKFKAKMGNKEIQDLFEIYSTEDSKENFVTYRSGGGREYSPAMVNKEGMIILHLGLVRDAWKKYEKDGFLSHFGKDGKPDGYKALNFSEFKRLIATHERLHLMLGLDTGDKNKPSYDEHIINILALEVIGRPDLASHFESKYKMEGDTGISKPLIRKGLSSLSTGIKALDELSEIYSKEDPEGTNNKTRESMEKALTEGKDFEEWLTEYADREEYRPGDMDDFYGDVHLGNLFEGRSESGRWFRLPNGEAIWQAGTWDKNGNFTPKPKGKKPTGTPRDEFKEFKDQYEQWEKEKKADWVKKSKQEREGIASFIKTFIENPELYTKSISEEVKTSLSGAPKAVQDKVEQALKGLEGKTYVDKKDIGIEAKDIATSIVTPENYDRTPVNLTPRKKAELQKKFADEMNIDISAKEIAEIEAKGAEGWDEWAERQMDRRDIDDNLGFSGRGDERLSTEDNKMEQIRSALMRMNVQENASGIRTEELSMEDIIYMVKTKELTPDQTMEVGRVMQASNSKTVPGEDKSLTLEEQVEAEFAERQGTESSARDAGLTVGKKVTQASTVVPGLEKKVNNWRKSIRDGANESQNKEHFLALYREMTGATRQRGGGLKKSVVVEPVTGLQTTAYRPLKEWMNRWWKNYMLPFREMIGAEQFDKIKYEVAAMHPELIKVATKWRGLAKDIKEAWSQDEIAATGRKVRRGPKEGTAAYGESQANKEIIDRAMMAEFQAVLDTVPDAMKPELKKLTRTVWDVLDKRGRERMDEWLPNMFSSFGGAIDGSVREAPEVGKDGKDAQNVSLGFRHTLKSLMALGWTDGFRKWWDDTNPGDPKKLPKTTTQAITSKMMYEQDGVRLAATMGGRVQDIIALAIYDQAIRDEGFDPRELETRGRRKGLPKNTRITPARQKKAALWEEIAIRSQEEIIHFMGDTLKQYGLSDIGYGPQWRDKKERMDVVKEYARIRSELGNPLTLSELKQFVKRRPSQMYFKLLPPALQNMVIWYKSDIERPAMEAMIDSGAMDDSNVYENWKRGFGHRTWNKPDWQKGGSGYGSDVLKNQNQQAQKRRMYDEFVRDSETGSDLIASKKLSITAANYVHESLNRTRRQTILNELRAEPNPNLTKDGGKQAGLVAYENEFRKTAEAAGTDASGYLTRMGYKKVPNFPGLSKWMGNSFQVPWVHFTVAKQMEYITNAQTKGEALQSWNRLNGMVKRLVMWSSNQWATQIVSTPFVHLPISKSLKHGLIPLLKQDVIFKGIQLGMEKKNYATSEYEHLLKQGFDSEVVGYMFKYGVRGPDAKHTMDVLFDRLNEDRMPRYVQDESTRLKEFIGDRFGMDDYVFGHYVNRMMYEYYDTTAKKLMKDGMGKEQAYKHASDLVNDTTGMLKSSIYGHEGPILQGVMFARDFTMSFLRMGTGALGMRQEHASAGFKKYFNSVLHAEKTQAEFDALVPHYRMQLAKVLMAKFFFTNMTQFLLSGLEDEDDLKWKWSVQNEPGKKFSIRLPWRDEDGRHMYLDPLFWREATNMFGILGSVPGLQNIAGRSSMNWLKSKANYGVGLTVSLMSSVDYMGRPLSSSSEAVTVMEKFRDYAKHAGFAGLPSPLSNNYQPGGRALNALTQGAGMPLKRGYYPYQKGYPWQEQKKLQDILSRESYERARDQAAIKNLTLEQSLAYLRDNGVGLERVKRKLAAQAGVPYSYKLKASKGTLKAAYKRQIRKEREGMLR